MVAAVFFAFVVLAVPGLSWAAVAVCGDGVTEGNEECDPGTATYVNGDPALAACSSGTCYFVHTCCKFNCQYVGQGAVCNDGNDCTAQDTCAGHGVCAGTANVPGGTACDDGLFCDGTETCDGNGSCGASTGDPCPGTTCNTCQEATDSCADPASTPCEESGSGCMTGLCDGAGTCDGVPNSNPCDDGLFCNGADTCAGGTCAQHAGDPCAGGGECADQCNEGAGNCNVAAQTPCTDDGNPCTDNACDGSGACAATNNAASCTDGLFCDGADTCSGGTCSSHAGDPCTGGAECANQCNEDAGNCDVAAQTPCSDDGNPCTDNACNGSGTCAPTNNSATCDDGVFCDGTDTCYQGTCSIHAGDPCTEGAECANQCNEDAGSCNAAAQTACTDDGNPCTDNTCDGNGACAATNNSAPCNDGVFCNGTDTCSGGTCSSHAGDPCPDNITCTVDSCDEETGCTNTPQNASCDDGLFCNGTETCDAQVGCQNGTSPCEGACSEENQSCGSGCDVLGEGSPCDDGNTCTLNDQCTDGLCAGEQTQFGALCGWAVVVGEDPKGDRVKTFTQTLINGDVCTTQLISRSSIFHGAIVAMKNSGPSAIRIAHNAEISGDIVTGGGGVKGRPFGAPLPYTDGLRSLAGGAVLAKNDASGFYDTTGTHPAVSACDDARAAYDTVSQMLGQLTADTGTGRIRIPTGGSATITAPNPGAVNVIDVEDLRGGKGVTLELNGAGDPATVMVLRVKGRLSLRNNTTVTLTGGLVPSNVVIFVKGRRCDIGTHSTGGGTLMCTNARIRIGYGTKWSGAWFAARQLARIGVRVEITQEPFQGF